MKVEHNATLRFAFTNVSTKEEALVKLRTFLHDNDWLEEGQDYDPKLFMYHTENDGTCEVVFNEVKDFTLEELTILLYKDLIKDIDTRWIIALYNDYTDFLVSNYSGIYLYRQKVELSDLKENDEVVIYIRQGN